MPRSSVVGKWLTAVVAVVVVAGCGQEPRLGASAADELRRGVDEVRVAAGAGDRDEALRALEALGARVDRAVEGGRLAEEDAVALRRGISRARRGVEREVVAPQPTPEPAVEPVPTPPESEQPGKAKGKGESRGNGNDGDDDEGDD